MAVSDPTSGKKRRASKLSVEDMDKLQLINAGIRRSEPIEGEYNYCKSDRRLAAGERLLCAHCTELHLIGEEKRLQPAEGIYIFEKGTIGLCGSCGDWISEDYVPTLGKLKSYLPISVVRDDSDLSEFGL